MRLPPLTDEELVPFLQEGVWVAKIATYNPEGSVRMTPLGYAIEGDDILLSTWESSAAARNLRRDPRASVLIDKEDPPYSGVHYTGQAEVEPEVLTPDEYAHLFGRYSGDFAEAVEYYQTLASLALALGGRALIRFRPTDRITWDFAKI